MLGVGYIPGLDTSSSEMCMFWSPGSVVLVPDGARGRARTGECEICECRGIKIIQQKPYHRNHNPPAIPIPLSKL